MYIPNPVAARNALDKFIPKAGQQYAEKKDFDLGIEDEASVSRLSPWIRNRSLPEWNVVKEVLKKHSGESASKFVNEVCWRTYWKGWLELRPEIWNRYTRDLEILIQKFDQDAGYRRAVEGRTGIDCFDFWSGEIVEKNYLHNHSRMSFASIWIHTLKLPWQLGADWFYRNLLDSDPASNTLSWRWIAGIQIKGESYLATSEKIRKYSNRRFIVDADLADKPVPIDEPPHPKPLKFEPTQSIPKGLKLGLLVTDEDVSVVDWISDFTDVAETAYYFPEEAYQNIESAHAVSAFRRSALQIRANNELLSTPNEIIEWADRDALDGIVMARPNVGSTADELRLLPELLSQSGKSYHTVRHWWDETLYPHATHGFPRFSNSIPKVLLKLGT